MGRVREDIKELIKESGGRTRAKRAAESWYENGKKTAAEKSVQTTGGRFQPGKVYVFRYNPKYATELPWYDANPVVLALDPDGNNDVGINLNLLPSDVKERLLDRIYNAYESEIKRESVGGKKNDARRQNQLSIRWEEAKNFLGPVWSAGEQTAGTLSLVAAQGAEAIGLKSDTTTWTDVLKNQPFGALRGVTDGIDYATSGQVTNKQGKVIMDDVSTLQTVFRFLNFYPAGATYQNDIIRMSKQTDGFAKAIKKSYTDAWVKAKINKDRKTMRQIEREVKEHNQDHRGTEFELKRWLPSAQRAFRAWSMPAAERYKKFAPKNIRPETQFLMDAYEQAINDH